MIKAAYLRVYVPRDLTSLRTSAAHGRHRSVVRADGHFVWAESDADDAFQVQWDGRTLVCPRHGRLRMLEGILAFDNAHPGAPLLPRAVVQRAADELANMKSGSPRPRSFILTSPWHVPLRWFSAFDATEREL